MDDEQHGTATARGLTVLARELGELVQVLMADGGADLPPSRIVACAAELMPTSAQVAVTLIRDGKLETAAASDWLCERVDAIQAEVDEGPALAPLITSDVIQVDDLTVDSPWPRFAEETLRFTNFRSLLSYRIYLAERHRAGLTFYSSWPHAFNDLDVASGAIFAAYCSLSAVTNLLGDREIHPRRGLEAHREIGIAIGILMAQQSVTSEEALGRLCEASRRINVRLPEVAAEVARTRQLPP
jgi:ANTAR domain